MALFLFGDDWSQLLLDEVEELESGFPKYSWSDNCRKLGR